MSKTRQANLSFRFAENSLFICRRGETVYEITVWPEPCAKTHDCLSNWVRVSPTFRLIDYPYHLSPKPSVQLELGMNLRPIKEVMHKEAAYELLRRSMPDDYTNVLAPFQSHQWNLILLLSFKPRFFDLLKSNPVPAYYLANNKRVMNTVYRNEPMMDKLNGMPQTNLLRLLDLPQTKSMVRIIKKIRPLSASPALLEEIRICARSIERLKKLSHLQHINAGALKLVSEQDDFQSHITPRLLEEISMDSSNDHYPVSFDLFRQTLVMHQTANPESNFPRINRLEQLRVYHQELHDQLVQRTRERETQPEQKSQQNVQRLVGKITRFINPPPVDPTEAIQALCTPKEVAQEGQMQHNCVGNYTARVRKGHTYIYRVLEPERATLSVVKGPGDDWQIGELKAACNKDVKEETRQAVEEWLDGGQIGI